MKIIRRETTTVTTVTETVTTQVDYLIPQVSYNKHIKYLSYKDEKSIMGKAEKDLELSLEQGVIGMATKDKQWQGSDVGDIFILRCKDVVHLGIITEVDCDPELYDIWSKEGGQKWGQVYRCIFLDQSYSWDEFNYLFRELNPDLVRKNLGRHTAKQTTDLMEFLQPLKSMKGRTVTTHPVKRVVTSVKREPRKFDLTDR